MSSKFNHFDILYIQNAEKKTEKKKMFLNDPVEKKIIKNKETGFYF